MTFHAPADMGVRPADARRTLVTGAGGFTAARLLPSLEAAGYIASGIDRRPPLLQGERWDSVDLEDAAAVGTAIAHHWPACVVHLAGRLQSPSAHELYSSNVLATLNLCEALADCADRPRLINVGSSAQYGTPQRPDIPVAETDAMRPVTAYGASKAAQERVAMQYGLAGRLEVLAARTFNLRDLRRSMRAVIIAGGRGTRLAPYTTILPKPLMPVGEMPILEIVIRQLKHAGIDRITLCVGTLASLLEAYFGDGSRWGVRIDYSREDQPLGTAGPLGLIDDLREPFLVMNGDILATLSYRGLAEFHARHGRIATITGCVREIKIDLGVLSVDDRGTLTAYEEKPVHTYLASMGVYMFQPAVLDYVTRSERLHLPDLVRALMRLELGVAMYRFDGYWLDIGRHDDFVQAGEEFVSRRRELWPE